MSDKYRPCFVIWEDACSVDEWTSVEHAVKEPCPLVHSVGFLISRDNNRVVLALNHDIDNSNLSCIMYIPANMVKKLSFLGTTNENL